MTIGYLVALRNYERPAEMAGVNDKDFERGLALGTEDRKNGPVPLFLGYYPDEDLPIKRGQEVTIPKGTLVTHRGKTNHSAKARKIKVHHLINGSNFYTHSDRESDHPITTPKVVWPGSGGYWSEVDINDIPEAQAAARRSQHDEIRESQISRLPAEFEDIRKTLEEAASRSHEGFILRVKGHSEGNSYMQIEAIEPGQATLASFVVETYFDQRKLILRIILTSSVCQPLPTARLVFRGLSTLMALAEEVNTKHCQPWNEAS